MGRERQRYSLNVFKTQTHINAGANGRHGDSRGGALSPPLYTRIKRAHLRRDPPNADDLILSTATLYIPRPARLLFQHDDGWSRYLGKHGPLSDWIKFAVERILACGTCAISVRRYCCASPGCTHSRFFQTTSPRQASAVAVFQ